MKMSMQWHKDCLNNMKKSLIEKKAELARLEVHANRLESQTNAYEYQIRLASDQGKDEFDAEKFGKKISIK